MNLAERQVNIIEAPTPENIFGLLASRRPGD